MNKEESFKNEINYIKNNVYKENLINLINLLPDYFFEVPASSTGKYHPSYALGKGGLLRHTKVAVRIGYELLNNPSIGEFYTEKEKDLMLIALCVHDGLKSGLIKEEYTRFDHPVLMGKFIENHEKELTFEKEEINFLSNIISSHMGVWNKDYNGNEILPIPKTKYERFVHLCDYLASRKVINISFDNNDIKE